MCIYIYTHICHTCTDTYMVTSLPSQKTHWKYLKKNCIYTKREQIIFLARMSETVQLTLFSHSIYILLGIPGDLNYLRHLYVPVQKLCIIYPGRECLHCGGYEGSCSQLPANTKGRLFFKIFVTISKHFEIPAVFVLMHIFHDFFEDLLYDTI